VAALLVHPSQSPPGLRYPSKMRSRNNRVLIPAFFLLLALSGTLVEASEPPATPSPESVVKDYVAAMKGGQYSRAAELMHPEALEKFRSMMLPLVEASAGTDEANSLLAFFRGVKDVEALKKLSPAELFAAFFAGIAEASPAMKEALSTASTTTIGSVPEGDVVHVVSRTSVTAEGIVINKMEVVSLKRAGESWRVLLSGEIEGIAQALKKAFSRKHEPE
jgi:hypothetical protein